MILIEIFQLFWSCCFQHDRSLQIINVIRFITLLYYNCMYMVIIFSNNVNELISVFQRIPKCRSDSCFSVERHIMQLWRSLFFFLLSTPYSIFIVIISVILEQSSPVIFRLQVQLIYIYIYIL